MKEYPILFSGDMVRAILAGRKTQFRRPVKCQPFEVTDEGVDVEFFTGNLKCPFGVGDRMWVKETWCHYHTLDNRLSSDGRSLEEISDGMVGYKADGYLSIEDFKQLKTHSRSSVHTEVVIRHDRWLPSIYMPRWASRITLEVTGVRVERLQSITEEDAISEGMRKNVSGCHWCGAPHKAHGFPRQHNSAGKAFGDIWNAIYAKKGFGWDVNPWVWVIEFRVLEK